VPVFLIVLETFWSYDSSMVAGARAADSDVRERLDRRIVQPAAFMISSFAMMI
jgi:hypothetical protein